MIRWKFRNQFILTVLLILPLYLFSAGDPGELTPKKIFRELDFTGQLPDDLTWMPESDRISYLRGDMDTILYIQEAKTGEVHQMVTESDLTFLTGEEDTLSISLSGYQWYPDERRLLLQDHNDLWYYDVHYDTLHRLTDTQSDEEEVQISPDGSYISFVRKHDLYAIHVSSGRQLRLTTTGSDSLLNGKLDWVYQEELVGRGIFKGYWWGPNSRYIAYLQFDESPVPEYPMVDWMSVHPELTLMNYPKAGDPNPNVRLGVLPIEDRPETVWMETGSGDDHYLPRVYWLPEGDRLGFMRLNRLQQHLEFLIGDITDGSSDLILEEKDPYWINIEDQFHFFDSGDRFLWGSERSGYRHLYLYQNDGDLIRQITSGDWVVKNLVGVDEERERIYFTGNRDNVKEWHLYSIGIDGEDLTRLSTRSGTHDPYLAESGDYYYDKYSDNITPTRISLHSETGEQLRYLEKNDQTGIEKYNLQMPEYSTFTDDSGRTFYTSLLKPADFDPKEKYPVLIYVYGGPHAQVVERDFGRKRHIWHQMLARRGYLIFSMDNRGSYGRGHHWEQQIYKQMGELELRDQLKGMEYLKSLPYVDSERIGIWGWSYGGYMTLYALTKSDAFRAGISVAPVTDWHFYDTIYTERYMSLPRLNQEGYRTSAPVNYASGLHGELLLVHGTGDDNVHLQNSIQMVDALVDAGKQFDFMVYPQQKHGIGATEDKIHLYEKMTEFLEKNLKPRE